MRASLPVQRSIPELTERRDWVEQLLVLARQQSSSAGGAKPVSTDLTALARIALADAAGAAASRQIDLGLLQSDSCIVMGTRRHFAFCCAICLTMPSSTPVGGTVNLALRNGDKQTEMTVEDSGPGIAEEDRQRVLDRFYRVAGTEGVEVAWV